MRAGALALAALTASACLPLVEKRFTREKILEMKELSSESRPAYEVKPEVDGTFLRVRASSFRTCQALSLEKVATESLLERSSGTNNNGVAAATLALALSGGVTTALALTTPWKVALGSSLGVFGLGLSWILVESSRLGTTVEHRRESTRKRVLETKRCREEPLGQTRIALRPRGGASVQAVTDARGVGVFDLSAQRGLAEDLGGAPFADVNLGAGRPTLPISLDSAAQAALREALVELRLRRDPPRLVVQPSFDDSTGTPNSALDAEEKALLRVALRNEGGGRATEVEVRLEAPPDVRHVTFPTRSLVGTIAPGESKVVSIPVGGGLELAQGQVALTVRVTEKYKMGPPPIVYAIETRPLRPPRLVLEGTTLADDGSGLSRGNGNRIAEPGEDIEIGALIRNRGAGPARGVAAELLARDPHIVATVGRVEVGALAPGEARRVRLAFRLAADYRGPEVLPLDLVLREERSRFDAQLPLAVSTRQVAPDLIVLRGEEERRPAAAASVSLEGEALPSFTTTPRPDAVAVIFGVEKYRHAPAAEFAANDARAMRELAVHGLGIPAERVRLRTDGATRADLEAELEEWLMRNAGPESLVLVYFSGHGAVDAKSGDPHLLPYDGRPEYLASTGYPLKRLLAALGKLKSRRVIAVLDACYSGVGPRSTTVPGQRPLVAIRTDPYQVPPNVTLLAASRPTQTSAAYPEKRHGLFTYFLLRGLAGAAPSEGGWVTLESAVRYLRAQVPAQAALRNAEQDPVVAPSALGERGAWKLAQPSRPAP